MILVRGAIADNARFTLGALFIAGSEKRCAWDGHCSEQSQSPNNKRQGRRSFHRICSGHCLAGRRPLACRL